MGKECPSVSVSVVFQTMQDQAGHAVGETSILNLLKTSRGGRIITARSRKNMRITIIRERGTGRRAGEARKLS